MMLDMAYERTEQSISLEPFLARDVARLAYIYGKSAIPFQNLGYFAEILSIEKCLRIFARLARNRQYSVDLTRYMTDIPNVIGQFPPAHI